MDQQSVEEVDGEDLLIYVGEWKSDLTLSEVTLRHHSDL